MAKASRRSVPGPANDSSRTQRIGDISVLLPARRPPAVALAACLEELGQAWQREGHLAALWLAWPRLAGPQLAPHCRPLSLRAGRLTVGAAPGPWLQALQYNRHMLLGALRGAGFEVREIIVQQHHCRPIQPPAMQEEAAVWAAHPSRLDVHGHGGPCPSCGSPAPAGELALWGHCSFCRREALADLPPGAHRP